MENSFEQQDRLSFHGIAYIITTTIVGGEALRVEVETEDGKDRWMGEFTSKYVEDITHKTGSFKKFGVFVHMLCSALAQRSESVFVDLLTYADLEVLKARRTGAAPQPAPGTARPSTKRYLILTYAAEFDRVHYPLPLAYEEEANPAALQQTIQRLRASLAAATSGNLPVANAAHLEREINDLKQQNSQLEQEIRSLKARAENGVDDGYKDLEDRIEMLTMQLEEAAAAHEQLRGDTAKEIRRLKREARERIKEAEQAGAGNSSQLRSHMAALEKELVSLKERLKTSQIQHRKEVAAVGRELEREVSTTKALRSRLREATRRLEALERGVSEKGLRGSGGRGSRERSLAGTGIAGPTAWKRRRSPSPRTQASPSAWSRSAPLARPSSAGVRRSSPRERNNGQSSRGSSPAGYGSEGSRVRGRSFRSGRISQDTPVFDPTAYQREKEHKLRQLAYEKKQRERVQISHSPSRATGRDTWIPMDPHVRQEAEENLGRLGRQNGITSRRTRSSRESGYTSTGSNNSAASKRSAARSDASTGRKVGMPRHSAVSPEPVHRLRRGSTSNNNQSLPSPPARSTSSQQEKKHSHHPPPTPAMLSSGEGFRLVSKRSNPGDDVGASAASTRIGDEDGGTWRPSAQKLNISRTRRVEVMTPEEEAIRASFDSRASVSASAVKASAAHTLLTSDIRQRPLPPPPANGPSPRANGAQIHTQPPPPPPSSAAASAEISEIDRRLNALQDFLRQAKAGAAGGIKPPVQPT